jgi:hypothetical protein
MNRKEQSCRNEGMKKQRGSEYKRRQQMYKKEILNET